MTCDGGTQTRSRDCVHPDEGLTANDECEAVAGEDTSEEEQECSTEGCPMPGYNATNDMEKHFRTFIVGEWHLSCKFKK